MFSIKIEPSEDTKEKFFMKLNNLFAMRNESEGAIEASQRLWGYVCIMCRAAFIAGQHNGIKKGD